MFSFTVLVLALTPVPPELDRPRDWVAELLGDGVSEVVVLFATERDGTVKRVAVRTHKRQIEVPIENWRRGLSDELKKARSDVKNPDSLRVIADERWRWQHVGDVSKAGKEAGFLEIGFAPLAEAVNGARPPMRFHHWLLISVFALFLLAFGIGILIVGFWLFPPAPVGQMEMQLPGSPNPWGTDEEFDPDCAVVIVAHVALGDADRGKIGALAVQTKRGRTSIPIAGWRPRLVEELRQLRQDPGIQDHVRIEGEKRLKWASVVEIMDACKEAGFNNIGFAPPPDQ